MSDAEGSKGPASHVALIALGVPFAVLVACWLATYFYGGPLLTLVTVGALGSGGAGWLLARGRVDWPWLVGVAAGLVFVGLSYIALLGLLATYGAGRIR